MKRHTQGKKKCKNVQFEEKRITKKFNVGDKKSKEKPDTKWNKMIFKMIIKNHTKLTLQPIKGMDRGILSI